MVAIIGLLNSGATSKALGNFLSPGTINLLGGVLLGICISKLLEASPIIKLSLERREHLPSGDCVENCNLAKVVVDDVPAQGSDSSSPDQSPSGATQGRRSSLAGATHKDAKNVPKIGIAQVPQTLKDIVDVYKAEFRWIDAGRHLLACQNAVRTAGPGHPVSKDSKAALESDEMEDIRKRYMKSIQGLGWLSCEDGWKLFKQTSKGTKVGEKGEFYWISSFRMHKKIYLNLY